MADRALIEQLKGQIAAVEEASPKQNSVKREKHLASPPSPESAPSRADAALSKIVALVNVSERSERAVRERLARDGFEEDAIDDSVDRAKSYGIIDDTRFAGILVRSRLSQGKGIPGIERELHSHGIELFDVPGWPDEFDSGADGEFDRALALLESRPPRSKNLREGAYRKLVGKGYSASVASSAARAWVESRIDR